MISNQESLRLQYALKQKAQGLGWQAEAIEVIDADLGITGRSTAGREGFKEVLAQVTPYSILTDFHKTLDILCGHV